MRGSSTSTFLTSHLCKLPNLFRVSILNFYYWLVVRNSFYFSIYWGCHHPNWRTHIFQRGWSTTNQIIFVAHIPFCAFFPWAKLAAFTHKNRPSLEQRNLQENHQTSSGMPFILWKSVNISVSQRYCIICLWNLWTLSNIGILHLFPGFQIF